MDKVRSWRPGILSRRQLRYFKNISLLQDCKEPGACSIDLRLSQQGWLMNGSVKRAPRESFIAITTNRAYVDKHLDLSQPTLLEPRQTYVIQLKERVDFRGKELQIFGQATGKSSIGRLDVLTRLIVDECESYDTLPVNYTGPLYVEVTPITFPIIVKEDISLNQLRLFRGDPELSLLSREEIELFGAVTKSHRDDCQELTLELTPDNICETDVIGFTTKQPIFTSDEALDLTKYKSDDTSTRIDPQKYWDLVPPNDQPFIRIEQGRFYILRSKERFRLPSDIGVYCSAISENLGEIRIHYAGFVHSGFGYERPEGAPLIFEIRGHTVNALLRDGELMTKISFYRTSEQIDPDNSVYDDQELQLSKYFGKWKKLD